MKFGSSVHKLAAAEVWYKAAEIIHLCKDTAFVKSLSQKGLQGQARLRVNVFYKKWRAMRRLLDSYWMWEKSHSYPGMPVLTGIFDMKPVYTFFYHDLINLTGFIPTWTITKG